MEEAAMAAAACGILAGYDGSPGSDQALQWAVREARVRGTVLTVCHAYAPEFPVPPDETAALDLARRSGERNIAPGLQYATSVLGPVRARPLIVEGSAAAVLCERCRDADMVVVGSHGRSGTSGHLLGSASSQVAAHAGGRVVVVRGHWHPAASYAPGPVTVGTDGSASSRDAVDFAFEEAALRDAPLQVVCAMADAPGGPGGARWRREDFEHAVSLLEKEHPEVSVLRRATDGGARDALLTAGHDAQMIVVGARGGGGIRGTMLGSVSRAVLEHAACPAAVVHPAC
jgi:nucleotide-binding universal stress UspA family protein